MSGHPESWLLLRGLTREARHWGDFPGRLAARLGVRVDCLDLPGNGRFNHLDSPASVEAMADWCHEQVLDAGLPRPVGVVAMSLGAMVTVAWAKRHGNDISRAVLINTSLRPFSPFYERLRPANYLRLLGLMLLPREPFEIETAVLEMTTRRLVERSALLADWTRLRKENPVARRNAAAQLLAAARYRAPPAAPLPELLLLAGAGDGLVASGCSQRISRCWNVPLRMHAEAGHDLPLDDAEWVLRQIHAWLCGIAEIRA